MKAKGLKGRIKTLMSCIIWSIFSVENWVRANHSPSSHNSDGYGLLQLPRCSVDDIATQFESLAAHPRPVKDKYLKTNQELDRLRMTICVSISLIKNISIGRDYGACRGRLVISTGRRYKWHSKHESLGGSNSAVDTCYWRGKHEF